MHGAAFTADDFFSPSMVNAPPTVISPLMTPPMKTANHFHHQSDLQQWRAFLYLRIQNAPSCRFIEQNNHREPIIYLFFLFYFSLFFHTGSRLCRLKRALFILGIKKRRRITILRRIVCNSTLSRAIFLYPRSTSTTHSFFSVPTKLCSASTT